VAAALVYVIACAGPLLRAFLRMPTAGLESVRRNTCSILTDLACDLRVEMFDRITTIGGLARMILNPSQAEDVMTTGQFRGGQVTVKVTWEIYRERLHTLATAVATQDTAALRVSHPYLGAVGITQVTLEGAGFVPVQGGGRLGLKLNLKEWRAPTQAPGARAPTAATQATTGRPPAKDIPNTGTLTAVGTQQQGAEWRQEGREIPLRPTPPAAPSADP
jgi:hypothetical protein